MGKTTVERHVSESIVTKDFNFRAEYHGYLVEVAYKKFVVWYKPLFSINADELPQLIEILTEMNAEITKSKGQS